MINTEYNKTICLLIDQVDTRHISTTIKYNNRNVPGDFKYLYQYILDNTKYMDNTGYSYVFTQRIYNVINGYSDFPKCKTCNKPLILPKYFKVYKHGYQEHCNNSCAQSDPIIQNKKEQTCLKHWNATNYLASDISKDLQKQYYQEHYGCDNPFQVEEFKQKAKHTMLEHGYDHPMHSTEIVFNKFTLPAAQKLYNQILQTKDILIPLFNIDDILNNSITKYNWYCCQCKTIFKYGIDKSYWYDHPLNIHKTLARCPICYPKNNGWSLAEKDVFTYLTTIYSGTIYWQTKENRNIIWPYELDIVIPDCNIAIEYNGVWFHSKEHCKKDNIRFVNNELIKTKYCEKLGITLIHIWEDEWHFKNTEIKEFLKTLITNSLQFDTSQQILILDRAKYPKTIIPNGYFLKEELPASIDIHSTNCKADLYHVHNCGKLIYEKSKNVLYI